MEELKVLSVGINADKTGILLTIGNEQQFTVSPESASELLRSLMLARAELLPAIDQTTPPERVTLVERTEHWAMGNDRPSGDIALSLPHPGYGWISFRFSRQALARIQRDILLQLQKTKTDVKSTRH